MSKKTKKTSQGLLEALTECPVNFDPNFDHEYGTAQPTKIAFVPQPLFDELCLFLKTL